jgi:hypothetical protein
VCRGTSLLQRERAERLHAPAVPTDDPAIVVDQTFICARSRRQSTVLLSDRCRRCGWSGEPREHDAEPTLLDLVEHVCPRRGEPDDPYPGARPAGGED